MCDTSKTILLNVDGTVVSPDSVHVSSSPVIEVYDYTTPLDPVKREIRLLILLPKKISNEVSCLMTKVSLDDDSDTLQYTALSYTWGDPNDRCPITLNFSEVSVTKTLKTALRHLQDEMKILRLWIDALCINQADDVEKSNQVRHMTEIYTKSYHTRIWLGEEYDNSDLAMAFINTLQPSNFEKQADEMPHAVWPALDSLIERPWWSRVWVLQEALVSTEPVIKCGNVEVDFERFVQFEQFRFKNRDNQGRAYAALKSVRARNPFVHFLLTYEKTREKLAQGRSPLYEWVIGATNFAATERRDKVYALLGLSIQEEQNRILPDYTRSLQELLILVTVHFLRTYKRLHVLQYYTETNKSVGLPSWVPDYSAPRRPSFTLDEHVGNITYLASQNSQCFPLFSDDFESLFVLGITVDTISFSSSNQLTSMEALCREWESYALQGSTEDPYEASCGRKEAFWRTLIHDRRFDGSNPPPSEFGLRLEVFLDRAPMPTDVTAQEKYQWLRSFWFPAQCHCSSATFILTDKGYMGTAPLDAQSNDIVCILRGGDVPFVLRKKDDYYVFVGECYVHGIMEGSAWQAVRQEEHMWFEIA